MSTDQSTRRRWNVLAFIHKYVKENSVPPTMREIADAVNITSTSVVEYHLQALEDNGFIERKEKKPRFIKLLVKTKDLPPAVKELMGMKVKKPTALPRVKRGYFDEPGMPIATEVVGLPYPLEKRRPYSKKR